MILAAAVVPHPPAIVPAIGLGLPEIEPVRAAISTAVDTLLATDPDRVVVIGPGPSVAADEQASGSFAGFGVDVTAGGPQIVLPAAFALGAWLLDTAGWTGPRAYTSSRPAVGDRDVVLTLADGDTAVGVSTPTHGDPRALALEPVISAALAAGDADALARLDPVEAGAWDGTGIGPLRLLGELVADETAKGAAVTARLHCDEAPFGVRYWVADWVLTRWLTSRR